MFSIQYNCHFSVMKCAVFLIQLGSCCVQTFNHIGYWEKQTQSPSNHGYVIFDIIMALQALNASMSSYGFIYALVTQCTTQCTTVCICYRATIGWWYALIKSFDADMLIKGKIVQPAASLFTYIVNLKMLMSWVCFHFPL